MNSEPITMQLPQATGESINLIFDGGFWRLTNASSGNIAKLQLQLEQAQNENRELRETFTELREQAIQLTMNNENMVRSSCMSSSRFE